MYYASDGSIPSVLPAFRESVGSGGGSTPITDPIALKGKIPRYGIVNDNASDPITTSAYTELIASSAFDLTQIETFETSGNVFVIAFGAIGSESNKYYISRGGNGISDLAIPTGTRVSVKAVSGDASTGEFVINFLS